MPAIAAHYKFGQLVTSMLGDEIVQIINENKKLFDLATQGPDLLFYNNPFKKDSVVELGRGIHKKPAAIFFYDILERKIAKNPAILAYVLGVICHYGLDVACHPFIYDFVDGSFAKHASLESDLDLVVLRRYDMFPHRYVYLPKKVDYAAVAAVYGINSDDARRSLKLMRRFNNLFDHPNIIKLGDKILKKDGTFSGLTLKMDPLFVDEVEELMKSFEKGIEPTANLVTDFYNAVQSDDTLPKGFEYNFEGERLLP